MVLLSETVRVLEGDVDATDVVVVALVVVDVVGVIVVALVVVDVVGVIVAVVDTSSI